MAMKASWLKCLLVVIPLAWTSHWLVDSWGHVVVFVLCFLTMIPLQNIFDWCAGQITGDQEHGASTEGHDEPRAISDLLAITLKNCTEATLAIFLMIHCHLRLLQSTIVGVVILHLLLVPGTAFFIKSIRNPGKQLQLPTLHAYQNPSLLLTGVLSIVLPTALFAALDHGNISDSLDNSFPTPINDIVRSAMLKMSRGISVMSIAIYVVSRIWRHSKNDQERQSTSCNCNRDQPTSTATEWERTPGRVVLPGYVLLLLIALSVSVMVVTAEFLVESIEPVRERSGIQDEWFGLILLPLVSFSPEAALALLRFLPITGGFESQRDKELEGERLLAQGRPIDLSIQFTLWWMPLLVLIGWWIGKPLHLLFDYFEVALLLGSCLLINYVMSDARTNFSEGATLVSFYVMIATAAWFYPGQSQVAFMLSCPQSVADAIASGVENELAG
ncbi:hypothetical protein C8Q78DRAFT_1082161 [Trametes maxima]|nr:hypothetical protein C8Q78DRAFT_1082161 [Trametes maxima]